MKNTIRELRKEKKMTQEDLAGVLKVSRQTVIALENGKYDPSLPLAFRISETLGKSIEDIFLYGEKNA